jgi:O-acetyl-ADP-ribose deacetylase (regulator of RNase III)
MAYREIKGNLFASKAQVLVNTVNCVGVMGKGIALEFRLRYPQMFLEYQRICTEGRLRPGQILPFRKQKPWILNFAVKDDWRYPSKLEWIEACLARFVEKYGELGITSVAIPWIGAMNGKLDWDDVHQLMRRYLAGLRDVEIEVIEFDPHAPDPLFERLQSVLDQTDVLEFSRCSGLPPSTISKVVRAIKNDLATSLSDIIARGHLGKTSVERLYGYLQTIPSATGAISPQPHLL